MPQLPLHDLVILAALALSALVRLAALLLRRPGEAGYTMELVATFGSFALVPLVYYMHTDFIPLDSRMRVITWLVIAFSNLGSSLGRLAHRLKQLRHLQLRSGAAARELEQSDVASSVSTPAARDKAPSGLE
ncbi:hypothetical protein KDL30_08360 [bacterium]|nr:hypothetical protein [bacterium]